MSVEWQPSATPSLLKLRAVVLATIRDFFKKVGVLEVETPIIESAATTDPHIQSFQLPEGFLRSSPEIAMKRLLASGTGDIYQLAKVFRQGEVGSLHNPEFTMLEWYRLGWDYRLLMKEVDALLQELFSLKHNLVPSLYIDCIELFQSEYQIDLLSPERDGALLKQAERGNLRGCDAADQAFDFLLNTTMRQNFSHADLVFIHRYPNFNPLLAEVDEQGLVQRFEVYWRGTELANGYSELIDLEECRRRFEVDNQQRKQQQKMPIPGSQHLLAALSQGLPPCSGVAVGVDRCLLCLSGVPTIAKTLAFAWNQI